MDTGFEKYKEITEEKIKNIEKNKKNNSYDYIDLIEAIADIKKEDK